ncbi:MAG: preprotein translocase subunit SecG [Alphaproteobacteria bacterium]|jgi:protein translocase SecG subunit|nr:preprotein translocase subunit SecG [Alphaproteobacteria bacterium]
MLTVFYVIQFIVAILLILVVMFQKTEGGTSLVSTNTYNSFFSPKAMVANPLTKITIVLGFLFFLNSIIIGAININKRSNDEALLEQIQKIHDEKSAPQTTNKEAEKVGKEAGLPQAPLGNK